MDGRGIKDFHKCGEEMSKKSPSEPRTARTSELNGSGGGREKGIRGPRSFVPVGDTNRDPVPPLARLAVGPGTKATYCPGPKDCRDKWPGTKACFVVVR